MSNCTDVSFFSLTRVEAKKHTTLIKKRACPTPFRFKGNLMLLSVRVWAGFPGHSQPCCLPPSHKIPKGLAILPIGLLIQQPRGTRPSHNDLTCSDWFPGESAPSSEEAMEAIAFWALTCMYSELVSRGSVMLLREPSGNSFGGSPTKHGVQDT
jgi:hypothetical protein